MSLFWMPCKNVSASFKGCHSARFRKRFPPYCSVIGPLVEDFPSTVPLLQRRSPITCCEPPSGARERRTNGWLGEITPGDSSSAGGGENPEKELSDSEMFLQLLERFGLGGGVPFWGRKNAMSSHGYGHQHSIAQRRKMYC